MIYFFSNHTDTSFLEGHFKDNVHLIKHPYIDPEWTMTELQDNCKREIDHAVEVDELIINGDYSIVAVILRMRWAKGKRTGFICMKKLNEPTNEKDFQGNIIHKNILKPIGVRWL